jgi:uncharacterized membrane-anchored protein YitT (DUF2179 family)
MDKKRRRNRLPQSKQSILIFDYIYIITGAMIVALAFNVFLFPNKIASGGTSGISIILGHLFQFEPGYVQWVLNIPLFIAGVIFLGKQFGVKSLIGTLILPFFVILTADIEPITREPFLAALFGGVGVGTGLGLVFRGKASTGGTDLAAQILHKYTGVTLGVSVLLIDGLVVLSSAIAFNLETGLYALVGLYVTGKTIDMVQVGLGYAKVAFIISEEEEKIRQVLLHDLDRGVTRISASGGYTDQERPVLMCVVNQMEVAKLKELVRLTDPNAFVVVADANEVLGEGFKNV